MALIKEIHVGVERGYRCQISRTVFGEKEHGSRAKAKDAAWNHVHEILRQQTKDGVSIYATPKERRKHHKQSPPATADPG